MYLFRSNRLDTVDYSTKNFKYIFNSLKYTKNIENSTPLMILCENNQQIFDNDIWFINELIIIANYADNTNNSLISKLSSIKSNTYSIGYNKLLNAIKQLPENKISNV